MWQFIRDLRRGGMYWQLKMSYIKIEKDSKDFLQINKETCII